MENLEPDKKPTEFFRSQWFLLSLKLVISLAIALIIFQVGMYVGFRKAAFSYGWGDNYHRTFGGPRNGFMQNFMGNDFTNGHGIAGVIIAIDGGNITIKGRDGVEKLITANDKTSIIDGKTPVKISALSVHEIITAIGKPSDDGTVMAEIIRVFPSPETMMPPPINMPIIPQLNY